MLFEYNNKLCYNYVNYIIILKSLILKSLKLKVIKFSSKMF